MRNEPIYQPAGSYPQDIDHDLFYKELMEAEEEQRRNNQAILSTLGRRVKQSFDLLMDGCVLAGEMEWVAGPEGTQQNESHGIFQNIYVDQWCDGEDSYHGYIYARCRKKWLKIPYYC